METPKNYWIKSGLLNIVQNFSGVFFGFASFYILVRLFSKNDFGIWTLFLTVTTIQEIVRSSLVQNALIKFISATDKDDKPKIISASFTISGIMTILCIIFNFIFARYLADLWKAEQFANLLLLYNVVFLITGFLTQFNCIEQAHLSFKGVFWSNFIRQSSFFTAVFIAFLANVDLKLIYLVYVQIFGALFSTLVSYNHVKEHLKISFKIEYEWISKIFNYGKFAFGTSVSSILTTSIDQMMLGSILSPKASGSFNIAVRITNLVDIPTSAVAAIVFPQSAKRLATNGIEAIKYLYEKSVGTILAILLPCLVILFLFSDLFITIIAGKNYEDAVPLLRITLFCSLFVPFGRQFGTILDSIGKTRITFIVVLIVALTNIALNYLLINEFGILGAAYATLIASIIGFIIAQVILRKVLKVNVLNTLIYAINFYPEFYKKYILVKFKK